MRHGWAWLVLAGAACGARGQGIASYLGPGVLSRGAGNVGMRAGEQVSLRLGATVSGFFDNGLIPVVVDETGEVLRPDGQYGAEATLFAYGTRRWRRAQLGLEYLGNYRHYTQASYYSGSDQMLVLGYTWQKSQRIFFDFRQVAATIARQNSGFLGNLSTLPTDAFDPATGLLFDNRATFFQSGMEMGYVRSPRTIFRAGGMGYGMKRQSRALVGVRGYTLMGTAEHRLSRETTVGGMYQHTHYDFPPAFGESDVNAFQGFWARSLGRYWTVTVQGGVFMVEAQGLERIQIEPAIAAILGTTTGIQAFYRKSTYPIGNARLTRRFRSASLSMEYSRGFNPGNGVYLTSRSSGGSVSFSYTGLRNWGFSVTGGRTTMEGIGQFGGTYRQAMGGAALSRTLSRSLYLVARYDVRHQDIAFSNFLRTSYRVSVGLSFSPGDIPLTLW